MVLNLDPLVTSLRPGHVESNYLHMSTNIDTQGTILRPLFSQVVPKTVDLNISQL